LKGQKYVYDPTLINIGSDRRVKKIYAGYAHSLAITDSAEVYCWGLGTSGQLGTNKNIIEEPFSIDELFGNNVKKGYNMIFINN